MARIVHVANFGRKPKGAFQHSVEHKISNGLIRNGHYVSNFSDRDVARSGAWLGYRKLGVSAANKALREFCCHTKPDLLLLGHADVIQPQVLAGIRRDCPSVKILQWNVDPVFEPDNVRRICSKLDVVDATLISTAGDALLPFTKTGTGIVGFLPNPVDASIESGHNYTKSDLPYDVFYPCGNPWARRFVCGRDILPDEVVQNIQKNIPHSRVLLSGGKDRPYLAGHAYQQALESAAIGLNISRRNDFLLYSSDRLAHMCGNGMAVLMDRATGYDKIFTDNEFAFFTTMDEMIGQTRRLVADTGYRQALAKAGRDRYYALFNEQIIARYIVEVAFGNVRQADYLWPTLISSQN